MDFLLWKEKCFEATETATDELKLKKSFLLPFSLSLFYFSQRREKAGEPFRGHGVSFRHEQIHLM